MALSGCGVSVCAIAGFDGGGESHLVMSHIQPGIVWSMGRDLLAIDDSLLVMMVGGRLKG